MLDFGVLPPEINSGRMYAGPGSGSMRNAATAWDEVAAELGTAVGGYRTVISELTSAPWLGSSSASMISAVAPYVCWLAAAAAQTEETANRARDAATAFEAAWAMTVPPPVIAANRSLSLTLTATNFFGQNTPAIAVAQTQYMEMWAQDAAAMFAYAVASALATKLPRLSLPPNISTSSGVANQIGAVTEATSTPRGFSGQIAATTSSELVSATARVSTLHQLSFSAASSLGLEQTIEADIKGFLATRPTLGASLALGMGNVGYNIGQQLTFGHGTTAGGDGAWYETPEYEDPQPGSLSGNATGPVSAVFGRAGEVGKLSVPSTWPMPTAEATPLSAAAEEGVPQLTVATDRPADASPNAILHGAAAGRPRRPVGDAYTNRYGYRFSVLTRTPSAG
ncbi:PPE family protein [Mycobacterium saskatchewanense]|uniref:PPE family protein n=1 Tax=Mycobacterium saskatchewanense TaxID=220927 RepID=UPI000A16AC8A|nr:PPE family protein [Mycobacterium saskatchewanense]